MTVDEIADEIYRELGSPSDLTRANVAYWLNCNLGKLNVYLQTDYALDTDQVTFSPALPLEVKDIFKQLYFVGYYNIAVVQSLDASDNDFVEITSDDSTIIFDNRIESTASLLQQQTDAILTLKKMISKHKSNSSCGPREFNLVPSEDYEFVAQLVENGWLTSRSTLTSE